MHTIFLPKSTRNKHFKFRNEDFDLKAAVAFHIKARLDNPPSSYATFRNCENVTWLFVKIPTRPSVISRANKIMQSSQFESKNSSSEFPKRLVAFMEDMLFHVLHKNLLVIRNTQAITVLSAINGEFLRFFSLFFSNNSNQWSNTKSCMTRWQGAIFTSFKVEQISPDFRRLKRNVWGFYRLIPSTTLLESK